ncbi:hypothetical protein [Nocardia sp. BMG111209]|uniref:hypothetical protein n=1 Tax=Nocardia sp. BMG111209 TaxID=1160137 RepID=UPI00037F8328|nr:hypothetical protein [Nocardia sp. BMG111209]
MITVHSVDSARDWAEFRGVGERIYQGDPFPTPDETIDIDHVLIDPPAAMAAGRCVRAFIARDGNIAVGRIAAIHDLSFTEYTGESIGFFGFYEAVDQQEVADALLNAARSWLAERGLAAVYGPLSPSMFYSAGIVVDDEPKPPLVGMPHNPLYYGSQFEKWGLVGVKDFYSYRFDPSLLFTHPAFARHRQLHEKVRARSGVTFRSMKYRTLRRDTRIVADLYNKTFVDFWGYSPLSAAELFDLLKLMLPVLDRKLVLLAELEGRPVGFLMGIPDVNQAAARSARFSSRWLRDLGTLWQLKRPGRHKVVDTVRVDMLFVDPECPDRAVAPLLIMELSRRIKDKLYENVEAAPVLDDSTWMKGSVLTRIQNSPHRVYRIYGCDTDPQRAR